ncbi:hypothetical protein [Psychromonas sp.]|uniref:hypothetical protein n=1 Tax=Psychromonas sp. TaxID=1884585 RepID=UPI00356363B1
MPANKHKHKAVKNAKKSKLSEKRSGLVSKYPKFFFFIGLALILFGVSLLVVGTPNNAKLGLVMLSIFCGLVTLIFANAALPKKKTDRLS